MSSSGQVSATPAAFRAAVTTPAPAPFNATLRGLSPGWYIIRAQFVKSSATEPGRKQYVHQPRWTTIRVDPQPSHRANVTPLVAGLGAVTLAALVMIWLLPRWFATQSNRVAAEDRMPILETR